MKKESFVLYDTYAEQVEFLTDEQAGTLFKSLFAYRQGKALPTMDGIVKMAFSFIKTQIDAEKTAYEKLCEKNRENVKKRWKSEDIRPNTTEYECMPPYTTVFERKESEEEKEKATKEKVEDKEKENYIKEKSTSVLKKKGDENFEDLDGRTDGQTDKPFCVEDEKTAKQREFFQLYPNVVVDNYSSSDYAEIDFNILIGRFEESAYLRSRNSFAWICSNWRKIAVGEYRDFDRRFERQERHSRKLGSEWDDLD